MCDCFIVMGAPVKNQVENGLIKIFDFRGQTIYVSTKSFFTLNDLGLHDEEGNKINVSNPLTADQRRSGHFFPFMMTVHSDQDYQKSNRSRMTCRACVQLPLDV